MNKVSSLPGLVAICILFASCNAPRYMYNPAPHNVPVLAKKGDSKVSAYYSSDLSDGIFDGYDRNGDRERSRGFDLQGAVAITDHFAVQVNYFNRKEWNQGAGNYADSASIHYKRHLTEIGLGYFTPIGQRRKVFFQVFGGAGKGNFSFVDRGRDFNNSFYVKNHATDVIKLYVQPAFVFRLRENFALSVSSRMSVINFRNIKTDYSQTELDNYQLNDLPYGSRTFWEPAFTNSFGFKKLRGIKFEYQFSASLLLSERIIDYRSFNFSLGVLFDLPKMFQSAATGDETNGR